MPGATGDGRTWPFPRRKIWPPLQWFNAASTLLVRQLGAGGGRGIRGLHWDAAGEKQEKSRRKAALSRDKGWGKPSSLCLPLSFICHCWFAIASIATDTTAVISSTSSLLFWEIDRNNPVTIFSFPWNLLQSGERQNLCSRLPSAGSSSTWLTAGFAPLL